MLAQMVGELVGELQTAAMNGSDSKVIVWQEDDNELHEIVDVSWDEAEQRVVIQVMRAE